MKGYLKDVVVISLNTRNEHIPRNRQFTQTDSKETEGFAEREFQAWVQRSPTYLGRPVKMR